MDKATLLRLLRQRWLLLAASNLLKDSQICLPQQTFPVDVVNLVRRCGLGLQLQSLCTHGYLTKSDGSFTVHINQSLDPWSLRMSIAHEIGHWLLDKKFSFLSSHEYKHYHYLIEEVCDHFAALLLLPEKTFIRSVLSRKSDDLMITMENLAKEAQVPMRAVISALQNSLVLNTLEYAVVALRPTLSAQVNFEIWASAYPRWGFIATRTDCKRVGFSNFINYLSCEIGPFAVSEVLCLAEKDPCFKVQSSHRGTRKWAPPVERQVTVNYKQYSDAERRRFILGVFNWNRPIVSKSALNEASHTRNV